MLTLHPQYVTDNKEHHQAVLLPYSEWKQVVEELEELDDIRAYDAAKAGPQDSMPFDQALQELQKETDA
jgi:PHD/YefM family antitoxin component YafN of YafNO toxin-antitoxin module